MDQENIAAVALTAGSSSASVAPETPTRASPVSASATSAEVSSPSASPTEVAPSPSSPRDFLYNFVIQREIPESEANAVVDKLIAGGFTTLLAMKAFTMEDAVALRIEEGAKLLPVKSIWRGNTTQVAAPEETTPRVEQKPDRAQLLMTYFYAVDNINANVTYVNLYLDRIAAYGEDVVFRQLTSEYGIDPRHYLDAANASPRQEPAMARHVSVRKPMTPTSTALVVRTDDERRQDQEDCCCGLCVFLGVADCCFCMDMCLDCDFT